MQESPLETTSTNWSFFYRNICHVASKVEYPNEDDHKASVIDKYRTLDAKRRVAATPIMQTKRETKIVAVETVEEAVEATAPAAAVIDPGFLLPFKVRKSTGIGWFIVEGPDGAVITAKPVRRDAAEKIAQQANEAAPIEEPGIAGVA